MNSCRTGGVVAGLAISLAFSPIAAAQPGHTVPYRLEYKAPTACPDERALRDDISERIGVDPFVADDPKKIAVEITPNRPHGWRAVITITDPETPTTTRELVSKDVSCEEIVADVSLVLRALAEPILIELPKKLQKPQEEAKEPTSVPQPPEAPTLLQPPPPPLPPPPPRRVSEHPPRAASARGAIAAGLAGTVFATPGPVALGGVIGGSLHFDIWSIGAEVGGFVDLSGSGDAIPGSLSLWTGTLSGCLQRTLSFCALMTGGLYHVSLVGSTRPTSNNAPLLAPGLRLAYSAPIWNTVRFRAQLDVYVPLSEAVFVKGGTVLWSSDPLMAATAFLLAKSF